MTLLTKTTETGACDYLPFSCINSVEVCYTRVDKVITADTMKNLITKKLIITMIRIGTVKLIFEFG